ncbi:MAG TPA: RIP metalloprotease RseP, partial [Puia sp.]|nr:RIP metalloprotease RseP [Puia sp.]
MILLAIDWSVVGIKILQFILSISILVVLHELGHFLTARWFKCRVEKFYLFFNPWFSLFKKKIGETEYGLGWIPFGGYVKIAGMIDESMDKEQMKQPAQPWEFRSKPAWQRLIIMLGGVTVNVLLAFVIFIMIMWVWGERYIPASNLKYGVYADSLARKIGVQDGDKIVAVAGKPVEKLGTVGSRIIMEQAKSITIDRNGQQMDIAIPPGFINQLNKNRLGGFTYIRIPMIVDSVLPTAKIQEGSVQKGDTLIGFNGRTVHFNTDIYNAPVFDSLEKLKGTPISMIFLRNGHDTIATRVVLSDKGDIGIRYQSVDQVLGSKQIRYSLPEAVPAGIKKSIQTLTDYIHNLGLLFTSKEVKVQDSLGGVVTMANIFPGVWDWQSFWQLTAVFSILLAFMNILPIPALDGGHALFTLAEMITGRKPSDKFMEYAQMVGMVLLLGLMAYALG